MVLLYASTRADTGKATVKVVLTLCVASPREAKILVLAARIQQAAAGPMRCMYILLHSLQVFLLWKTNTREPVFPIVKAVENY